VGQVVPESAKSGGPRLRAPEPIQQKHDCSSFRCGKPILDDWFRRKARQSEGLSARTFVVCEGQTVVGFYSISGGAILRDALPTAKLRKNQPEHVPVVIVARLGVDQAHRRKGIGSGLLKDAILRAINISRQVGFRAVLVHALDDEAVEFYRKYGFIASPVHPRTMILPLETAMAVFR
jgi:GNAT superfamily N-acetyltransferase